MFVKSMFKKMYNIAMAKQQAMLLYTRMMHCAKNNLNLRIKATLQRREQMQRYMTDFLKYTAIAGPGIRLAYCTVPLHQLQP